MGRVGTPDESCHLHASLNAKSKDAFAIMVLPFLLVGEPNDRDRPNASRSPTKYATAERKG